MSKKFSKTFKQKIIASIVTCLLIFNFIFPPRSHAIVSEIADTLQTLVCWIGDSIINGLQEFMIGETAVFENYTSWVQKQTGEVTEEERNLLLKVCDGLVYGISKTKVGEGALRKFNQFLDWLGGTNFVAEEDANFKGPMALIKYSVPNIVSNKIPAFDVNFFRPMDELNGKVSTAATLKSTVSSWYYTFRNIALVALLSILLYLGIKIVLSSVAEDKARYKKNMQNWLIAIVILFSLHYIMAFTLNIIEEINNVLLKSITIETKIDSQIDGSRSDIEGKEGQVIVVEGDTSPTANIGYDLMMGSIRVSAEIAGGYADNMTYTIMYIVLVVYTILFTVIYLKRTIYLTFLTIIAPLVAVTYPIDKEKDGKSQAFDMWIREYFFNALIQPIHLVLYYILIASASELAASGNYLYGIVAIGFMIPAEKLIRKMFGMEGAGDSSSLGAFAGGALAASAFSRLKGAGRKVASKKDGKGASDGDKTDNSKIRMKSVDDVDNMDNMDNTSSSNNDENEGAQGGSQGQSGINMRGNDDYYSTDSEKDEAAERFKEVARSLNPDEPRLLTDADKDEAARRFRETASGLRQDDRPLTDADRDAAARRLRAGAEALKSNEAARARMKAVTKAAKKANRKRKLKLAGNIANGALNVAKAGAKKTFTGQNLRRFASITAGAAGLTIGAAAGIASGDINNVVKYGGIGAGAGAGLANKAIDGASTLGGGIINTGRGAKQAFQKGYYGDDYEQKVLVKQAMKEAEKDKETQKKYQKLNIDMKNSSLRENFYRAGYTNEEQILKCAEIQQQTGLKDKEMLQCAIMSRQVSKLSDADAVEKEIKNKLIKKGKEEKDAEAQAKRNIEIIKKINGLN